MRWLIRHLSAVLARIETYDGHPQMVILTIPDIGDEAIETYSLEVARTWGIGQAGRDNGVLITVLTDPEDFKVRIEIGYGLEGAIPDSVAYAIYEYKMRPHFKDVGRENYFVAFTDGITALDALIRTESTGDPRIDNAQEIADREAAKTGIMAIGIIGAALIGFVHWGLSGAVGAGAGLWLGSFLGLGFVLLLVYVVIGAFGGLLAHMVLRAKIEGSGGGSYAGGGFGGSSGGGGFSGGGGSFGGGGFSGSR